MFHSYKPPTHSHAAHLTQYYDLTKTDYRERHH
ncbi:hypothetical protein BCEP4_2310010 [Burkholderia cepacia]|nr:hypothetical protein BCEP4_2310010 [Burkholderia cepacia]